MATTIKTETDHSRSDLFFVNPFDVEVKEELRGRRKPPADGEIIKMGVSLAIFGQRQPCEVRRLPNKSLRLTSGFTRNAAARLLRHGFDAPHPDTGEMTTFKDEEFRLKVVISDGNDEQAFLHNVVENAHRNQTSPIDDAYNQERLRDRYNYDDKKITGLYQYSDPTKVGRLRKLLILPTDIQDLVHDDKLPVAAALELLDIEDETKRNEEYEAIRKSANEGERITAAGVRSRVRNIINDDDKPEGVTPAGGAPAPGATPPKPSKKKNKARSVSELRKFITAVKDEHQDEAMKTFCKEMLEFINGRRGDKKMRETFDALLDAERS